MARGISVVQVKSQPLAISVKNARIPCYIGQAPIWQVDDSKWEDLAGQAFIIKNTDEMKEKVGFYRPENGSWAKQFSLCCPAVYHLEVKLVAPIAILVNKQSIQTGEKETKELVFTEGQAVIEDPYIVLSSFGIEGKEKGTDYKVEYDGNGRNVIVTALTEMATESASYKKVNGESITFSPDTFEELDYLEQTIGIVPTLFASPIWDNEVMQSSGKTVGQKLMEVIQEPLNGHWYVQGIVNLSGETMEEAKTCKGNFKNYKVKAAWPCVCKSDYIYPLSVVYAAIKQQIDGDNDGVPYVSASNEPIDMDYLCTESGAKVRLKEADSTALNELGIATANFSAMQWVTWGVCMSNYTEAGVGKISPDQLNDVAVQMKDYVSNLFQETYARQLDKPMTKRAANDIVTGFQSMLDGLVTIGALIYAEVAFLNSENSTAQLADGVFTFSIAETNTPPGKAIIGKVAYSAEALTSYFTEGGTEK